jgi:PTS system nitrogen regulatory IIA component
MRLGEALSLDRVTVHLEARDKAEALRGIARMFAVNETAINEDSVFRVLSDREALASTGVGSGVAIPHGRIGGIDGMRAAMAICPSGVDFDSVDGRPASIFVAVLAPDRHTGDHLKALARISRLLRDERVRDRLLHAADSQSALQIFIEEDERH